MNEKIKAITAYLFNCNFLDDNFDPEDNEEHLLTAEKLQKDFLWKDIIVVWQEYLYTECTTANKVINFANLFFYYDGADNYVPEPYKFLGYLYAKVDMEHYWEQAGDLFDSISIDILSYQQLINLAEDPYYDPLKDPNILMEIENWKKK